MKIKELLSSAVGIDPGKTQKEIQRIAMAQNTREVASQTRRLAESFGILDLPTREGLLSLEERLRIAEEFKRRTPDADPRAIWTIRIGVDPEFWTEKQKAAFKEATAKNKS